MKYLIQLYLIFNLISCNSLESISEQSKCPENYECYVEIEDNKSIVAKEDTIGKTYLRLAASKNTMVVKYIYRYKDDSRIADDEYSEVIFFEIPKTNKTLKLENSELADIQLYILKSCFCRDGGYKKIENGNIEIKKTNNNLSINLEFEVDMNVKLSSVQTKVEI